MHNVEKEFKWQAFSREDFAVFKEALASAARLLSSVRKIRITDRYLDNAGGDFSARKIALRIRCSEGKYEATLKTRTALKNGLARRQEFTLPLPGADSFPQALRALQARREWENLPLAGLKVRFTLRNFRQTYQAQFGAARCEAALDNYTVYAGGKRQTRREIELEFKSGAEKDFDAFVKDLQCSCALRPAEISKVAGAEKLLAEKS